MRAERWVIQPRAVVPRDRGNRQRQHDWRGAGGGLPRSCADGQQFRSLETIRFRRGSVLKGQRLRRQSLASSLKVINNQNNHYLVCLKSALSINSTVRLAELNTQNKEKEHLCFHIIDEPFGSP